jgi:hypothetical protein
MRKEIKHMQNTFPRQRSIKLVVIFAAFLIVVQRLPAQNIEVQIMVDGPWSYVADPDHAGKIVIIAPNSSHHGPVTIFPGEFADQFSKQSYPTVAPIGNYDIDFQTTCSAPAPPPNTFKISGVPTPDVKTLIAGPGNRFSISLPAPCSYSSARRSRAKIDTKLPIGTGETDYTTWMVLHYKVSNIPRALVTGSSDDLTVAYKSKPVGFKNINSANPAAISIVLGSDEPYDTDPECDSTSNVSVRDAGALFKKVLHAHYPTISNGKQTDIYSPNCVDASIMLEKHLSVQLLHELDVVEAYFTSPNTTHLADAEGALTKLKETLNSLGKPPDNVIRELDSIRLHEKSNSASLPGNVKTSATLPKAPQTKMYVQMLTAGAGDCRGAQFDVTTVP